MITCLIFLVNIVFLFYYIFYKNSLIFPKRKPETFALFLVSVVAMLINNAGSTALFYFSFGSLSNIVVFLLQLYIGSIVYNFTHIIGFKFSVKLIGKRFFQNSQEPEFTTFFVSGWFSLIWTSVFFWIICATHFPIFLVIANLFKTQ